MSVPFSPQQLTDRYAEALQDLVTEKSRGKHIVTIGTSERETRNNVTDFMEALRKSVKGDKPTLAKAPSGKAQKGRADARSRPAVHAAIHNYEGSCYIGSTRRRPWDGFTREQIFPS